MRFCEGTCQMCTPTEGTAFSCHRERSIRWDRANARCVANALQAEDTRTERAPKSERARLWDREPICMKRDPMKICELISVQQSTRTNSMARCRCFDASHRRQVYQFEHSFSTASVAASGGGFCASGPLTMLGEQLQAL